MGWTREAKILALEAILEGAIVGLTENGEEVSDGGYTPQLLIALIAATNERVTAKNTSELRFGPWEKAGITVDGWLLRKGRDNLLTGIFEESQGPTRIDSEFVVRAGALVIELL